VLRGEVRHVREPLAVEDREIDDALDAGLARQVEGQHRFGQLLRGHGVQQEQGGHTAQGLAHGGDVQHVAGDRDDPGGKSCLGRIARQGADGDAAADEFLHERGADGSRGSGDEDGHLKFRLHAGQGAPPGLASADEDLRDRRSPRCAGRNAMIRRRRAKLGRQAEKDNPRLLA
jgi:hypothetical protein